MEEVLAELAGVEECLVAGVPEERFGQLVAAIVVTAPGHHLEASDVIAAGQDDRDWSTSKSRSAYRR